MSELTKVIAQMAVITLKNLSDALLQSASQISKLNHSSETFTQAKQKQEFVSSEQTAFTKRDNYKIGDRVMVMLDGAFTPTKFRVCDVLQGDEYLAYGAGQPKLSARTIRHDQILGLDPDR